MVVLWYSVLAARVPHPREMIRSGYRRVLLRPGLLGAAAAAPLSVLGWLLVSRPEREVGSVVADPVVIAARRFDDRIVRDADAPFLEVLAAAGQAITRLQLPHGTETDALPALECAVCGQVTGHDDPLPELSA